MTSLIVRLEDAVAKALLVATVLLVFAAAVARSVGTPIIWSVDLAQLFFVWLAFIGANRAMRTRSHVGVDYFVRRLGFRARRGVEVALAFAAIAFLLAMAWEGRRLVLLNIERIYGDSGISYAWVTGAVPAGCLLIAITLLIQVIDALRNDRLVFTDDTATDTALPAQRSI